MAKTINWANVSIGFDARKIKAGVDMSRQDLNRLTKVLRDTADPMKMLERDTKLLDDALKSQAISASRHAQAIDALKSKYSDVNKEQSAMIGGLTRAGVAVAGLASFSKVKDVISQSLKAVDEQANIARTIGVDINNLRKFATEQQLLGGIEFQQSVEALKQMQQMVGMAAIGQGKGQAVLEALGLDAKTLVEQDPIEQFNRIMAAIRELGNASAQAAVTEKLFGDSRLIQSATASFEEVRDAQAMAHQAVIDLAETGVAAIEKLNDKLDVTKSKLSGITDSIVGKLSSNEMLMSPLMGFDRFLDELKVYGAGVATGKTTEQIDKDLQSMHRQRALESIQQQVTEYNRLHTVVKETKNALKDVGLEKFLSDAEAQAKLDDMKAEDKHAQDLLRYQEELNKLKERQFEIGRQLIEKYDPTAKAVRELQELTALLDSGAIGQSVFDKERQRLIADAAKNDGGKVASNKLLEFGSTDAFKTLQEEANQIQEEMLKKQEEQLAEQKIAAEAQKQSVDFLRSIAEKASRPFR